jgi:uncharacterized protein (DUF1697 family)
MGRRVVYHSKMRQIVLLRGINIGPRNRIAMPALRELLTSAGFADVRTHLQSGNVVLSSDLAPGRLARESEQLIARNLGIEVGVVVRTRDELSDVVRQNPLRDVVVNPKRHQVTFLSEELDASQLDKLAALAVPRERFVAIGRELYVWHPDGIARSRLWTRLASQRLGVTATSRNWSTVTKLLAIASE